MKLNISKLPYTVKIQATVAVQIGLLFYDATTLLYANQDVINRTTKSYSSLATDGTHFWIRPSNQTYVKYNGENCEFVRSNNYFMVTIPDNFDPSIPFVVGR